MHHSAKVTFETVELIRRLHERGEGPRKLAKDFGLPVETIRSWVYYKTRISE